jgi:uncharacterized SAM-binding protein YcdF (DUF218 family)
VRRGLPWLLAPAALLAALAGGFVLFLASIPAAPAAPDRRTEAILVLTGGPGRLATGFALLDQGMAPRLLVSGVAPGVTLADLARLEGREAAALAGRVTLGRAAASTAGNAAEAAAYARAHQLRSARVVTAAWHMPRAMVELRRALPGVELIAHPAEAPPPGLPRLAGEYLRHVATLAGLTALLPAFDQGRR